MGEGMQVERAVLVTQEGLQQLRVSSHQQLYRLQSESKPVVLSNFWNSRSGVRHFLLKITINKLHTESVCSNWYRYHGVN